MNAEKLKRLQSQVRIGGKGTARRKKKVMHQTATTDDKKLQSSLKKLSVSTIPGIEEVNIIKDDLTVIHFNNPKAQASLSANTFAVTGHGETKKIVEMLPEILPQLGQETVVQLRMFANSMTGTKKAGSAAGDAGESAASANMLYSVVEEDDVPMLVSDFDEVAKMEAEKVGAPAITTINNEQPASEFETSKKVVESKEETVAVLPIITPKEISNAEAKDVKKINEIQPLDNSNLNIKLIEDSKQQVINEKDIKKQEKNIKKENLNKTEKSNDKSTKDVGKVSEVQKKQEKNSQKQEASKQKTKSEGKNQKGSKENRKPDDTAIQKAEKEEKKTDEPKKVGGESSKPLEFTESSENVKGNIDQQKQTQNQQKQSQSQKQLKSESSQDKQQNKEEVTDKQQKKQNQPDQQKKGKQDQKQRQTDPKENKGKQQNAEKSGDNSQQTKPIAEPQGQEKQQEKIPLKGDQQQEKQKEQKQAQTLKSTQQQQQPKGEQLNKQKNKQGPQKSQNQDNQKKSELVPQLKKAEPVQQTAKQEENQQALQLKSPEEKSTTEIIESEKTGTEKQTDASKQSFKEITSKEVLSIQPETLATADERKQKMKTPPKGDKLEPKKAERDVQFQNQPVEDKDIKNNIATTDIGAPSKHVTPIADVSIKTVALQSLESTEKMLQMVNEMTKTLPLDDIKTQKNEAEKEGTKAELPVEKLKEIVTTPTNLNMVDVNTVASAVEPKLNANEKKENQNQTPKIIEIVKDTKISDSPNRDDAINANKGASEPKEVITRIVQNTDAIQQEVNENKEKTSVVNLLLQTTQSSAAPIIVQSGEKLPKQPTLAEIVQTQPIPAISATVPNLSINTQTADNTPKKDISVAAELPTKQPPMADVLQSQSPQISPIMANTPPNIPVAGEIKDKPIIEILVKGDEKDNKLVPTTLPATETSQAIDDSKIEVKADTAQLPALTEDKIVVQSNDKTLPVSPKQKVSPPKQTGNTKATQETSKQQTKPLPAGEAAKQPSDTKLKLVTKPQPGQQQQQQQQQKIKQKPASNNKSTPTTPTTPTKASPEKSTPSPKSTTPNPKSVPEASTKKANSPQKQQQTDVAAKSKPAQGAGGKVRPGGSNAASAPVGVKKANTPPAVNKINPSTGGKQQDVTLKAKPANTPAAMEQSNASALPSISSPTTENTAEQPAASK